MFRSTFSPSLTTFLDAFSTFLAGPLFGVRVNIWDEAGQDAYKKAGQGTVSVRIDLQEEAFDYEVPSERQCRSCHETGDSPILGYTAMQLEGELNIAGQQEHEGVIGYALGNCVHCHNGSARDNAAFDLSPESFVDNTVGQETSSSASAVGIRVVPGAPEQSVLWRALVGQDEEDGVKTMPPLGVQRVDEEAIELFREWINNLEPTW